MKVVLDKLRFPEGPVVLDDGSVLCVEVGGGAITGIDASGVRRVYAETGGGPNGAAIGPDGALYVCNNGGRLLHAASDYMRFDSLAVEADGNVCIATLIKAGITVVSPQGQLVEHVPIDGETYVTNLCFGGPDRRTAYVTLSGNGELVALDWPRAGLALAH